MSGTNQQMSHVELDGHDLPAFCPNPSMPIWSNHPKVYLDLGNEGVGKCPYCGTVYRLKPGAVVHGH
ncbi:zinc-finger domain-containing protein [Noviherbaspirillum pedocola]|nr:zinc-finger domain-containing protein [Noviherbaspirillum pedocola]